MTLRFRHHRHHRCEHHVILPTSTERQGRCLDCGALVPVPAWLHVHR